MTKLSLTLLALAGALCGAPAFAADTALAPKAAKPAASEHGDAVKPKAAAESPRKVAVRSDAPGKVVQQEVPTKVVLAAD